MLASNADIQNFLGDDKISVGDVNAAKPNIEAERLIKGQLSGIFTALTLSSWNSPENTPEQVRGIAGRLAAAFLYRGMYSEEQEAVPEYAQLLYNEAIMLLQDIKTGNLSVLDEDNVPIDSSGSILGFWPNNSTVPVFSMDQKFS